jgi:hypothetical protein
MSDVGGVCGAACRRWRRVVAVAGLGLLAASVVPIASRAAPNALGFEPRSVTFVAAQQGWVLGTSPCASHRCISLRETTDAGRSWLARPLPTALMSAADRSYSSPAASDLTAMLNVRFADPRDGWIYGGVPVRSVQSGMTLHGLDAALWSTHDGGSTWARQPLGDLGAQGVIFDLEAARGTACLMESNEAGGVTVESSRVDRDDWARSSTPLLGSPAGGAEQTGSFVLEGGVGWLVEGNDRGTTGSARLVDGRWREETATVRSRRGRRG